MKFENNGTFFTGVEMAVFGQSLLKCRKQWYLDNCKVSRIAFAASLNLRRKQIDEQYTKVGG